MSRDRRRSIHALRASTHSTSSPMTTIPMRVPFCAASVFANDRTSVATTVTIPALPSSMRTITTRRRTGWLTTLSASLVVKPTPDSAERAWKRALSRDMPVSVRAIVATRVMSSETTTTARSEIAATTVPRERSDRQQRPAERFGAERERHAEAGVRVGVRQLAAEVADAVAARQRQQLQRAQDPERAAAGVDERAARVARDARRDRHDRVVPAAVGLAEALALLGAEQGDAGAQLRVSV